jgi:excisionase family DNA binding protein
LPQCVTPPRKREVGASGVATFEAVRRPKRVLLTFAEAGDVLGCRSRKVRQLVDAGVLPSVYLGRLHRIVLSDVEAYVEQLRRQCRSARSA